MSNQMTANGTDWAALGKAIARTMAASWGAEWQPQSWDQVEERDPLYLAAYPQLKALWDADEDDEAYRLKNLCRDAWQEELAARLQYKRGTRSLHDVLEGERWTSLHLQLAGHATITGSINREKMTFSFRLTRHQDATIALPENAEFALEPLLIQRHLKTGRLQLMHESSGYRHYLGRRDVHCGYGITLVLPNNTMVEGRYECSLHGSDCEPLFYFSLAGGIDGTDRVLRMPYDAEFLLEGRSL